jgi:plasmid maintenance system antidote protein VapI
LVPHGISSKSSRGAFLCLGAIATDIQNIALRYHLHARLWNFPHILRIWPYIVGVKPKVLALYALMIDNDGSMAIQVYDINDIHIAVREIMYEVNMTQHELASRLDISQPTISQWTQTRDQMEGQFITRGGKKIAKEPYGPEMQMVPAIEDAMDLHHGTIWRRAGWVYDPISLIEATRNERSLLPSGQERVIQVIVEEQDKARNARSRGSKPRLGRPRVS